MKEIVATDATVSIEDAKRWVETLYRENPNIVIDRAMEAEPAVMALAAHVAARTESRLMRNGVPEHIAKFVVKQICYAGGLSVELMRLGNAELWRDLIDPTDNNEKGMSDEQSH